MDWLNEKIGYINRVNGVFNYPSFRSYGGCIGSKLVRGENGQVERRAFKAHRWDQWVETARRDKATLTVDRLFKMGKAVNDYFVYQTHTLATMLLDELPLLSDLI